MISSRLSHWKKTSKPPILYTYPPLVEATPQHPLSLFSLSVVHEDIQDQIGPARCSNGWCCAFIYLDFFCRFHLLFPPATIKAHVMYTTPLHNRYHHSWHADHTIPRRTKGLGERLVSAEI